MAHTPEREEPQSDEELGDPRYGPFRVAIGDRLAAVWPEYDINRPDRAHIGNWLLCCLRDAKVLDSAEGLPSFTPHWQRSHI